MTRELPTLHETKQHAKMLRAELARQGTEISHAQGLERIAGQHGYRDWNALHAAIMDRAPKGWVAGGRVSGRYLSQPFAATVRDAVPLQPGWYRLVLDLDEAVDVVRFDSFSNFRKQLRVEVGPDGYSKDRTSDGVPHVELDL